MYFCDTFGFGFFYERKKQYAIFIQQSLDRPNFYFVYSNLGGMCSFFLKPLIVQRCIFCMIHKSKLFSHLSCASFAMWNFYWIFYEKLVLCICDLIRKGMIYEAWKKPSRLACTMQVLVVYLVLLSPDRYLIHTSLQPAFLLSFSFCFVNWKKINLQLPQLYKLILTNILHYRSKMKYP